MQAPPKIHPVHHFFLMLQGNKLGYRSIQALQFHDFLQAAKAQSGFSTRVTKFWLHAEYDAELMSGAVALVEAY